jgi:hypothetical protein
MLTEKGWWGMFCWNGLSTEQQDRLVNWGNLPLGFQPEGECQRGAELTIETMYDKAPGPRFYCRRCAIKFLEGLTLTPEARRTRARARGVQS